jgi:hypothetical protein
MFDPGLTRRKLEISAVRHSDVRLDFDSEQYDREVLVLFLRRVFGLVAAAIPYQFAISSLRNPKMTVLRIAK